MRIAELLDILRDYPQDWEVELAVVAPGRGRRARTSRSTATAIEGVLPWEDDDD